MATAEDKAKADTRRLWVATIIAVVALVAMKVILGWGIIPAIIGAFSVAVIWWSISRAFASAANSNQD
ncbi:MAG: hypothetical protein WAT65_07375 [Candidatus Nanopelagicales bacterium]